MLIHFFTAIPPAISSGQEASVLQNAAQTRFEQIQAQLEAQANQIHERLQTAQDIINKENLWENTMLDLQEQLSQDAKRMYPSGIENYPQVKEQIDALFATYVQEVYSLLETARQNEAQGSMRDEEIFQAFIQGVNQALNKRNTAFTSIEEELNGQGIKLFAPQEPEQAQDSPYQ